jgi:hypothetical protein
MALFRSTGVFRVCVQLYGWLDMWVTGGTEGISRCCHRVFLLVQSVYVNRSAQTGITGEEMSEWIQAANNSHHTLQTIYVENDKGERKLLAEGYEFERLVKAEIGA